MGTLKSARFEFSNSFLAFIHHQNELSRRKIGQARRHERPTYQEYPKEHGHCLCLGHNWSWSLVRWCHPTQEATICRFPQAIGRRKNVQQNEIKRRFLVPKGHRRSRRRLKTLEV